MMVRSRHKPRGTLVEPHPFVAEMGVGPVRFRFDLYGRETCLGTGSDAITIDQLWMDTRTLYPTRKRAAANFDPITDYFWARCQFEAYRTATDVSPAQCDIYLLAKLLPHARAHGSRRLMADAVLGHTAKRGRVREGGEPAATDFERLLALALRNPQFGISSTQFHERTAAVLMGRRGQDSAVRGAYDAYVADWLRPARAALQQESQAGLERFLADWLRAQRRWGRRAGHAVAKAVLDVLSYECRAAFHRCYTVVWQDLLHHLGANWHLGAASMRFIQLWHVDRSAPTADPALDFHLFHGHVFGLHPASALLMQSETGRRLVGAFVRADTPQQQVLAYHRVLGAVELAVHVYDGRRDDQANTRRKRPEAGRPGYDSVTDD